MKATEKYNFVVLFIILYKVDLTTIVTLGLCIKSYSVTIQIIGAHHESISSCCANEWNFAMATY